MPTQFASFKPFSSEINTPQNITDYFNNLQAETGINFLASHSNPFMDKFLGVDPTKQDKLNIPEVPIQKNVSDWLKESKISLPTVNAPINPSSSGDASKAINYLVKNEGLSKEIATAIAANLKHESNFKTHAIGDKNLGTGNEAFGIAQWRLNRKDNLQKFLKNKELPYNSFEGQLSFIVHELKNGSEKKAWEKLQSTTDIGELTKIFDKYYERSDGKSTNKRVETAYQLYQS